ncbi:MAG: site-specific integrase [Microscillaceae bacterium]|nr:site-specific integrase [Microscillaceae bacterium]
MIGVTTAIVQDKRIRKQDGTYAIKLRITHNREQKYYPLNIHLTPEDWKKAQSKNPRNQFKELQIYFNKIEQKALEVIRTLDSFSFSSFEKKFIKKTVSQSTDVLSHLKYHIQYLKEEGQIGNSENYKCTMNSITKFIQNNGRKKLNFSDITPEWLSVYEKWMLENGKSITTISMYLRSLRAIFNKALDEGIIARDIYPFSKRKYQIPAGRNVKKAIPLATIKQIVNYMPETPAEEKARDLWLFSYLCNGANVKDLARLQYKNIDAHKITFIRAKTERTSKKNLKPIVVMLIPEIKAIIEKWGTQPKDSDNFVFDILEHADTPLMEHRKIHQATKTINKYMKRIGIKLGIETKLTTYTARHSFATVLKRSGASIEFISESLGHKDLRTTENYLDSFEDSVKEEFQKKLLDFD